MMLRNFRSPRDSRRLRPPVPSRKMPELYQPDDGDRDSPFLARFGHPIFNNDFTMIKVLEGGGTSARPANPGTPPNFPTNPRGNPGYEPRSLTA